MKFYGIYQQDDRDIRDERRRQKRSRPSPSWRACGCRAASAARPMAEARRARPRLWRRDAAADDAPDLPVSSRHEADLRTVMQGLHDVLLDTRAACGDDTRGVMCTVNPRAVETARRGLGAGQAGQRPRHSQDGRLQRNLVRRGARRASEDRKSRSTGAPTCRGSSRSASSIPPVNDIDVYTPGSRLHRHRRRRGKLEGFNVAIGGGMGRTDHAPKTYPRLANVIGFIPKDQLIAGDRCGDVGAARLRRSRRRARTRVSNTRSTTRASTGSRPRSSDGSASRSSRRSRSSSPPTAICSAGTRARTAASICACSSRTGRVINTPAIR